MAKYEELDATVLFNEVFIDEYATFLCMTKQLHRNKDDPLKATSATTIFIHVKNHLKRTHPRATRLCNDGISLESLGFYRTMVLKYCKKDRNKIGNAFIEEDLPIEDNLKAPAIRRSMMEDITKSCCRYVVSVLNYYI